MNKQWKAYCEKYLAISPREQYMVLFTGLIAIIFIIHTFFIDGNTKKINKYLNTKLKLNLKLKLKFKLEITTNN